MVPYVIIGVLALVGLALAALALRIASWRLALPEFKDFTPESFPGGDFEALRPLAEQLERGGLVFAGLQRERRGAGEEWWQALFHSAEGCTWAVAERCGGKPARLVLHSFFPDRRGVTTSAGEFADYDITDDWRLTEQQWDDFESQLQLHRQKTLGIGRHPMEVPSVEEFRTCCREVAENQFQYLVALGFLAPIAIAPNHYKVIPWKQPRIALRMMLHSLRNCLAERNRVAEHSREMDAQDQEALDLETANRMRYVGIDEHKYLESYKEDKKRGTAMQALGWTKVGALLFFSILLLLTFFYARNMIDGTTVLIVAGVLLVHELGHVAAMALFGYRDIHVMFMPLLARLAPEKHLRVPAFKEFLVLLMGPLPGLLVGWGLLLWGYLDPSLPELWREIGLWAALINNVNFLAVLPCDGGRVVNLLIFERIPPLRLIYLIFSAFAVVVSLVVYWITMDIFLWPVLVVLVSTFFAIPDNWRHARMSPWAKQNLSPDDSEADALVKAFQIVEITDSTRGFEKRGWTNFVERVVRYGCSRKLGIVGTVGCLLLFFSFLYTPLYVFGVLVFSDATIVAAQGAKLTSRLEQLRPPQRQPSRPLGRTTREALDSLLVSYRNTSLDRQVQALAGMGVRPPEADPAAAAERLDDREIARAVNWSEAVGWLGEGESSEREETAAFAIATLIEAAREGIDRDEFDTPLSDLGKAWWGLSTCEPRSSLGLWIDWLYLEGSLLRQLERISSQGLLPPRYAAWYVKSLAEAPKARGPKLAYLLLRDLQAEEAVAAAGGDLATFVEGNECAAMPGGFRLGRSRADREFRARQKGEQDWLNLRKVMSLSRSVQGLPTAEDMHAGLIVAKDWETREEVDAVPLAQLDNDQQRQLWKARLEAIQRLVHYRKLARAALEIEMSDRAGMGRPALAHSRDLSVPVKMQDIGGDFSLKAIAPDGTELLWRLSPIPPR